MSETMRLDRSGEAITLFAGGVFDGAPLMGLQLSGKRWTWAVKLTRSESLELARRILERWHVTPLELDDLVQT